MKHVEDFMNKNSDDSMAHGIRQQGAKTQAHVLLPREKTGKEWTTAGWKMGSHDGPQFNEGAFDNYYKKAEKFMDEQWNKLIWPIIQGNNFSSVLEVAAGACRNTEKLVKIAGRVVVTDIDSGAVAKCQKRFEGRPGLKLEYHAVDGTHLPVADESMTFIYQFDAGVHFHSSIIRAYMLEFHRILQPGGTGFFHHSNLGESKHLHVRSDSVVSANPHGRSNMTKALMRGFAKEAGLVITCHSSVTWGGELNLDAFALFYKPGPGPKPEPASCPKALERR